MFNKHIHFLFLILLISLWIQFNDAKKCEKNNKLCKAIYKYNRRPSKELCGVCYFVLPFLKDLISTGELELSYISNLVCSSFILIDAQICKDIIQNFEASFFFPITIHYGNLNFQI